MRAELFLAAYKQVLLHCHYKLSVSVFSALLVLKVKEVKIIIRGTPQILHMEISFLVKQSTN